MAWSPAEEIVAGAVSVEALNVEALNTVELQNVGLIGKALVLDCQQPS
jgi:hypothetical protein